MTQWQILVLGVLRLGLNADYDRIQELANQHKTLRQMLGHSDWAAETYYELQTLKDNLRLFTPQILDRINQEVVRAGHQALKKSPEEGIVARADSFVVKTDVHFPTDINLLLDAVRKTIDTCVKLCDHNELGGWRQHAYHQRQFKKQYRQVQRLKHSPPRTRQSANKSTNRYSTPIETIWHWRPVTWHGPSRPASNRRPTVRSLFPCYESWTTT